jgi:hypothetical protein
LPTGNAVCEQRVTEAPEGNAVVTECVAPSAADNAWVKECSPMKDCRRYRTRVSPIPVKKTNAPATAGARWLTLV